MQPATSNSSQPPLFLSVRPAAQFLGISPWRLLRALKAGQLPSIQFGGVRRLIPRAALEKAAAVGLKVKRAHAVKLGGRVRRRVQADHFEHFYRIDPDSGCWIWMAGRHRLRGGYGGVYVGGHRHERAHRYSWKLHRGPIPAGMHVLHRCDCPPCVNPAHLFLGTNADNVADRVSKGRAVGRRRKVNL